MSEVTLYHGDCFDIMRELMHDSINMCITDPPYEEKYNYIWKPLGEEIHRLLISGGNFITLLGHYQIHFVINALSSSDLRYWWILSMYHKGNRNRMAGKWVTIRWKPALWYLKDKRNNMRAPYDLVSSDKLESDLAKHNHKWGQSSSWFSYYINELTNKGDTIIDPFMGGGTTGIACIQSGRNFIGIEKDIKYYEIAEKRIKEAQLQIRMPI